MDRFPTFCKWMGRIVGKTDSISLDIDRGHLVERGRFRRGMPPKKATSLDLSKEPREIIATNGSLPPVPKFGERTVSIPVDRQLLDLGKTVAIGPTARKMLVLSEEAYLGGMSRIIQRDYFPDLARLQAEEAYLDAVEREDLVGVNAACQRLQELKEDQGDGPSLEEYRAVVTSEDNASFEQLQEDENALKRKKYQRVHGGPALLRDDPARRLLLLPSKTDPILLDKEKSVSKRINVANTRIRRPELLSEFGAPEGMDIRSAYTEIMQRHHRSAETSPFVSATSSDGYSMVFTPMQRPEATPTRHETSGKSNNRSKAVKQILKASASNVPAPFSFETKSMRAKRATESMIRAMQSPIIPRTPGGSTPLRKPDDEDQSPHTEKARTEAKVNLRL